MRKWHRWIGLVAGIFFISTAFTGVWLECERFFGEEEALRENEQRMRAIVETAVEGIITIDERGLVESINPASCQMFGYGPDEVVGCNVSLLMPSPHREQHDDYLANYLRTGEARIIGKPRTVKARRKNGEIFPARLHVSEFADGRRLFTRA